MNNRRQQWNHGQDKTGRFRGGKTARDRANGAAQTQRSNQQARASYTRWCSSGDSAKADSSKAKSMFPWHACNGKRTRALRS